MDGLLNCIVCGRKFSACEGGYDNHKCPESVEKRREIANRQAEQDYLNRRPSEAMRINYGFHLLSLSGDWSRA